jgi:nucleoid-associated protein YgaU
MKYFLFGMTGVALAIFTAGCVGPELAQVSTGAADQEWKAFAADSYSGYRPPRVTTPVEKDQYQGSSNPSGAAADPVPATEDPVKPATDTVVEEKPAAKVEEVKEEKTAAKVEEVKEEKIAPAAEEQKAAAKADEAKADNAAAADSEIYVVKSGDSLSIIAKKFYKDGNLSGVIFKANSNILKNPNMLRPGMKLVIPKM